ncbi:hypothetical protein [Streptomyces sp. NPDC023588]|uniref:hypothetical protein n=1 Tax=Streptomyces sp. NPDC023588 TaxID=3154907 RepID=UPI0033E02C4A
MSLIQKAAVMGACVLAASAALVVPAHASSPVRVAEVMPASAAAAYCQQEVSGDQHFAQARCYNYAYKYYAVQVETCDGRACAIRRGPWRAMNSGQWSAYADAGTWIVRGGVAFGN